MILSTPTPGLCCLLSLQQIQTEETVSIGSRSPVIRQTRLIYRLVVDLHHVVHW